MVCTSLVKGLMPALPRIKRHGKAWHWNASHCIFVPATYHGLLDVVVGTSRGAGEVFGKKQSGREHWSNLHAASLPDDADLLEAARATAAELIGTYGIDPAAWPPSLLGAIAYNRLPNLDFYDVPDSAFLSPDAPTNKGPPA